LTETRVDVGVVDDLPDEGDLPLGELLHRLVGVLDGPIDPVAEAELLGEADFDVGEREPEAALADPLDEAAVVVAAQRSLDDGLEAEAFLEIGLFGQRGSSVSNPNPITRPGRPPSRACGAARPVISSMLGDPTMIESLRT